MEPLAAVWSCGDVCASPFPEVKYFAVECARSGSLVDVGCGAEQRVLDHAVVAPDDRADAVCEVLAAVETLEFDGAAAGREVLALLQGSVVCGGDPGSRCQAGGEGFAGETCGEEDNCDVVYDDEAVRKNQSD